MKCQHVNQTRKGVCRNLAIAILDSPDYALGTSAPHIRTAYCATHLGRIVARASIWFDTEFKNIQGQRVTTI